MTYTWSGVSRDTLRPLSASATFTASGNTLTIVLTNTSSSAAGSPADTLGSLVWNMPGSVVTNSTVNNVTLGTSTVKENNVAFTGSFDLNKEYMYNDEVSIYDPVTAQSYAFRHGISSVGIGQFATNNDTFFERLRGKGNAGSSQADRFSIAPESGTTGAANNFAVVNNSLTFTLLYNAPVNISAIEGVNFSYGSASQTNSVPEPTSAAVVGLGIAALFKRRKTA